MVAYTDRLRRASRASGGLPGSLEDQRTRLIVAGMAPVTVFLFGLAGVLDGSGARLIRINRDVAGVLAPESPSGVAWLSLVFLLLLAGIAILPWLTSMLGGIIVSSSVGMAEANVSQRYALGLRIIAPRLAQLLPPEAKELVLRRGRRVAWDIGLASGSLLAFILSMLLLFLVTNEPVALYVIVPVAALGLAHSQLVAASDAAFAYAQALETTIDLHRLDLLQALHLPLPANLAEERRTNRFVTQMLERSTQADLDYVYGDPGEIEPGSIDSARGTSKHMTIEASAMVNWSGYVSAWVDDATDARLEPGDDGFIRLLAGKSYFLNVRLGQDRSKGMLSAEVRIEEGIVATPVIFDLLLDSQNIVLPPMERRLVIESDDLPVVDRIPFWAPQSEGKDGIAIQVLQKQRLIQVLSLMTTTVR
jgi:hypothetical protein